MIAIVDDREERYATQLVDNLWAPHSGSVSSLALIAWPYHAGIADVGMGVGATAPAADA